MHNPTQFKLKTSVAAVLFALSSTAVWAGDVNQAGAQESTGAAAIEQSAASGSDSAKEALGWRFVDGKDAGAGESAAATSDEGGKAAMSEEPGEELQAAKPEEPQGDAAAGTEPSGEQDQAAASSESGSEDQSAKSEEGEDSEQSAMTEEGDSDQAAAGDEEGGDQAAASEDESASEQAATSGEQSDSEQSAASDEQEGSDQAAAAEEQGGEEQSAQSEQGQPNEPTAQSQVPAHLQGKVIVIIPKDWEGSMEGLLSALQSSPDAKDIVIVQQGTPGEQGEPRAESSQEPDDTYEASRPIPSTNQQ